MREFTLSATGTSSLQALAHGRRLATGDRALPHSAPLLLSGESQIDLAAVTAWVISEGHSVVLQPRDVPAALPGARIDVTPAGLATATRGQAMPLGSVPWQVAMYTSGSTGAAQPYAFTLTQLDQLASWYTAIYGVSSSSVICTSLPVTYNFTMVAGLYLAATLGASLHLAATPDDVFTAAARLARDHDRCVILGNPVLLSKTPRDRLPPNVLIDSGGAPLSTTAISRYREDVADLREGYGLTETGSLTHFDTEATPASLGTVASGLPGVRTLIEDHCGQPRIALTTPALGVPAQSHAAPVPGRILTSDVGRIDSSGRLRVLGRSDDHPVSELWPRDTLDLIGPVLGTRCALVRHPTPTKIHIRLQRPVEPEELTALRSALTRCHRNPPRSRADRHCGYRSTALRQDTPPAGHDRFSGRQQMTIEPIYDQHGLYDYALPRYEFDGATDEQLLNRELAALAETPAPQVLEIGCGTGRMTTALRPHASQLTCVDASATMLDAFRLRHPDLTPIQADAREFLAHSPRSHYNLVTAFWSLNYPLLTCFETNTGTQIIARDLDLGRADAATLLTDLTGILAPAGQLLIFFFDPESAEQRFVTDLWETIAPFPGSGRDFTRQLLIGHLQHAPGELRVDHLTGHMVASDLHRAETWFRDGHLKGFPALTDDTQTLDHVRSFLTSHRQPDHTVRIPSGMHLIRYTHT